MTIEITHSKDGVEIPEDGLKFEFTIEREGEPDVHQTIVLHDLLAGLNCKVSENKSQSQAQSFASFATQMGYEGEDAEARILADYPRVRPRMEGGEVVCRSWSLITQWEREVRAARQKKARETMEAEGTEISPGQISYALDLIPKLREKNFDVLADTLHNLVQVDEVSEGPKGAAMSGAISKARDLLDMTTPRSTGDQAKQQPTHQSSEKVDPPEEPF